MESRRITTPAALEAFGGLANEHRLAIFRLLVQAGPGGLPAGDIADKLGIPASSLSFHLAHLTRAGLTLQRRESRSLIYSANFATMNGRGRLHHRELLRRRVLRSRFLPEEKESVMKRLHVHVGVNDLDRSIQFYSNLFAAEPTVKKDDYAKWMLEDPRVNFAISVRAAEAVGVRHLGIQVETQAELGEVYGRLKAADAPVFEEGATTCCYAKSEKSWIDDPQGVPWETFHTTGESTTYGGGVESAAPESHTSAKPGECCIPSAEKAEADAAPKAAPCCGPRDLETVA